MHTRHLWLEAARHEGRLDVVKIPTLRNLLVCSGSVFDSTASKSFASSSESSTTRSPRHLKLSVPARVASQFWCLTLCASSTRRAAQSIGAVVDVQLDGHMLPNFEGIESTGKAMWSKRSESSADERARSGAGISSGCVCVKRMSLSFCQHCACTPAQVGRTLSNAVTSA